MTSSTQSTELCTIWLCLMLQCRKSAALSLRRTTKWRPRACRHGIKKPPDVATRIIWSQSAASRPPVGLGYGDYQRPGVRSRRSPLELVRLLSRRLPCLPLHIHCSCNIVERNDLGRSRFVLDWQITDCR